jgi:hypothetical protein
VRPTTPYERTPTERSRPTEQFFGRVQRALITSVDPDKGTCSLEFESTPGTRQEVNLPLGLLSFGGEATPQKSAWSRRMPLEGSIVLCGFDSNAEVRILGYDAVSYAFLSELQKSKPFGWTRLVPGEFDDRSVGGAYLRGDAQGNLYLAGGLTSILLDKRRGESQRRADLDKLSGGASVFRRGVVKRSPLPFVPEGEAKIGVGVPPTATPATAALPSLVEDSVDLRVASPIPGGLPVLFASQGFVMDPDLDFTGGVYAGPTGQKRILATGMLARWMERLYPADPATGLPGLGVPPVIGPVGGSPTRPFEGGMDVLGNMFLNFGAAPLAPRGLTVWAPGGFSVASHVLNLSGNVYLGGPPTWAVPLAPATTPAAAPLVGGPAICGTPFVAAMAARSTAIAAAFTALAVAAAAVTGGTPPQVTAFAAAVQAFSAAMAAAEVGFATSSPAWLSQSVFVAGPTGPVVLPPLSPLQV